MHKLFNLRQINIKIMKSILGLDLGTNSIGWALIKQDFENKQGEILGMGSRIIPMSQDILGDFEKGNSVSQTAERTFYRSVRRLRERYLLRRERLHRVLHILGFLPHHYSYSIDWEKRLGQFLPETEPKLVYDSNNQFIFNKSFEEMLEDFRKNQPELVSDGRKTPYDWTIYYLRKKALSEKIEKEELAWILLNFNQKRGYYQLRGEEQEENPNKLVEFHALRVVDVIADEPQKGKNDIWYSVVLENGWIYRRSSKISLSDWVGKTKEFIVTTELNDDGTIKTDKEGKEKRSFRAPLEGDWTLLKKKTEADIDKSNKTVGEFIYDTLLANPNQKIKGKLVRTIERQFYTNELRQILNNQKEFHSELQDKKLLNLCIEELYKSNEDRRSSLQNIDSTKLFVEDIIFYQRPLKSKKSLINNCKFEYRIFQDENGIKQKKYIKTAPKSHPLYQELRLWKFIKDLRIYEREKMIDGKLHTDVDVTDEFIKTENDVTALFDWLNQRKEIKQDTLLSSYFKIKKKNKGDEKLPYRWNYVEDKEYPCNQTHSQIINCLDKIKDISTDFLTKEKELELWHIVYSVSDKIEIEKALKSFARKNDLAEEEFVTAFKKIPPFKNEYGAYSEKALKKMLPLMRVGDYWNYANIDKNTQKRIEKILSGEFDNNIKLRTREKSIDLTSENQFKGLPEWLVSYVVYDRHSENDEYQKWKTFEDIDTYLQDFKQNSLRNPVVEQVITETLRVVRDIWKNYGDIEEIHVELGRELKNDKKERERLSRIVTENENTNLRIKALLMEMANDETIENVRPYSPMQQEILKIYEDGVINSDIDIPEDISKITKLSQPTKFEIIRYKLWLEQKYRSPYTGKAIPLTKLFTSDYEIEHIIPQSKYFDDSYSNKVICESAVNTLKGNMLGYEFIKNHAGEKVQLGYGAVAEILSIDDYQDFIQKHYSKNQAKKKKLLLEEIPEQMIERQLNDTRYISKEIKRILSNIVREKNELENTSKNVISTTGAITDKLKQDWGLNEVWNRIITPRFERMNALTNSELFGQWENKQGKRFFQTQVPIEYQKGFSKKRIDHRHHAMDALVIACATRSHVNYLNNQSAKANATETRYALRTKLCIKSKTDEKGNYEWRFEKPWIDFTETAQNELEKTIVSFKKNLRVINKTVNYYQRFVDGKKVIDNQVKGDNWAVRKPMHKETIYGKVELDRIKVVKGKILTASRKSLDSSFNLKNIESITDTGIQKILKNYLQSKGDKAELAFTPEGIEDMNKNIALYNDGISHKPIYKVRVFEVGSRFALGENGNKKDKYVEAAKGTNLFFGIYADENGKRSYETIHLNIVIERLKQGLNEVPERNEKGEKLLFHLSPNDVVYVPSKEDENSNTIKNTNLLYKIVSFTGNRLYGLPLFVSKSIVDKMEFTQLNKIEFTDEKISIKEKCIKVDQNRLGEIMKVYK